MNRILHFLITLALAVGAVSGESQAGFMYGAAGATFLKIDSQTGVATVINSNVGLTINALAWDSTAKLLYGAGASGGDTPFFTINPSNGALNIINANIGPNVLSLDFDNSSQTLYAATFFNSLPRRIGTVNTATGAFTGINSNVGHDIDSIAFGPGSTLYAIGPSSGADDLFTINKTTGVASTPIDSDIGPNNLSFDYDNPLGSFYGAFFGGGGTISVWRSIDASTGVVSAPINPNIGSHPLTALTAIPEPSSLVLIALGMALVGAAKCFRRRHSG